MAKLADKPELSQELIKLRWRLRQTQRQFAKRLGIANTTLCRWETKQPPHGKVLAQLESVAREGGQLKAAEVFRTAHEKESQLLAQGHRGRAGREAIINPRSRRAKSWLEVFETDRVPITSRVAHQGLGPDGPSKFYRVDVQALNRRQRQRLLAHLALKWNMDLAEVEAWIEKGNHSVPILAKDLIVTCERGSYKPAC